MTAGVDGARGRAVVIIDGDMQDPPEVIPEMVDRWRDGFEVVYGQRENREGETWFKLVTASAFTESCAASRMSTSRWTLATSGSWVRARWPHSAPCRNATASSGAGELDRFSPDRGQISTSGAQAGETKFPVRKMTRFALDGITSFSFFPLRLATWTGFAVSIFAFLYIVVVLILKATGVSWLGYTSLMASILFLGGVQLLMIGIMGEYLARIFDEVKRRPLYLVGEHTDGDQSVIPPERPVA